MTRRCFRSEYPICLDSYRFSFDFYFAQWLYVKEGRNEFISFLRNLDGAHSSCLLHTRGKVDGVADSGVFHSQIRANFTYNDQACIDSNTKTKLQPIFMADFICIRFDPLLDL